MNVGCIDRLERRNIDTSASFDIVDEKQTYEKLSKRIETFEKWPHQISQSGTTMSRAGFVYTG